MPSYLQINHKRSFLDWFFTLNQHQRMSRDDVRVRPSLMLAELPKNVLLRNLTLICTGIGTPTVTKSNDVVSQLEMQFEIQKKCQKAY